MRAFATSAMLTLCGSAYGFAVSQFSIPAGGHPGTGALAVIVGLGAARRRR